MLPIKKLSLLEPVLLQGKITRSTATLYSIQSMLNSLENGRCSFIFTSLVVHTTPIISTKNAFLYFSQFSSPYSTLTCSQNHPYKPTRESSEDWHSFNLSLIPQNVDCDNSAHNHWFLITQVQKIGVLQVAVSDEDASNTNGKPSNPPSLMPSNYCYYFHTLLIPSQELTFPLEISGLTWVFSYTIHVPLHSYV